MLPTEVPVIVGAQLLVVELSSNFHPDDNNHDHDHDCHLVDPDAAPGGNHPGHLVSLGLVLGLGLGLGLGQPPRQPWSALQLDDQGGLHLPLSGDCRQP